MDLFLPRFVQNVKQEVSKIIKGSHTQQNCRAALYKCPTFYISLTVTLETVCES